MPDFGGHDLTVHQANHDDVYSDVIRAHRHERNCVREGRICKVYVDGKSPKLFAIRGLPDKEKGWIRLDEVSRDCLSVDECSSHKFYFEEANWLEWVCWSLSASDPASRLAAYIAVWSVVLGIASLAISIYFGLCPLGHCQ
jgi:hypothetical protein